MEAAVMIAADQSEVLGIVASAVFEVDVMNVKVLGRVAILVLTAMSIAPNHETAHFRWNVRVRLHRDVRIEIADVLVIAQRFLDARSIDFDFAVPTALA